MIRLFLHAALLLVSVLTATATWAHEARPAYLQVTQLGPERFDIQWRTPVLQGMRLPVVLKFPDAVRNVTEPTQRELADSLIERRIVETIDGLAGQRIEFIGLQTTITDVLVRTETSNGVTTTASLRSFGQSSIDRFDVIIVESFSYRLMSTSASSSPALAGSLRRNRSSITSNSALLS